MEISVGQQVSILSLDTKAKEVRVKHIREGRSNGLYILLCVATLGIAHFVQWCRERSLTKAIEKLKAKIVSLQSQLKALEKSEAPAEKQKIVEARDLHTTAMRGACSALNERQAAALSAQTTVEVVADHDNQEEPVDQPAPALTCELVEEKQDLAPVEAVGSNAPFTVEGFLDIPFMTFFETAFSKKRSLAHVKESKCKLHLIALKRFNIVKTFNGTSAFYQILFDVWNLYVHKEQNEIGPLVSLNHLSESDSDCVGRLADVDAWVEGNKVAVSGLVNLLNLNRGMTEATAAAVQATPVKKPNKRGLNIRWADEAFEPGPLFTERHAQLLQTYVSTDSA